MTSTSELESFELDPEKAPLMHRIGGAANFHMAIRLMVDRLALDVSLRSIFKYYSNQDVLEILTEVFLMMITNATSRTIDLEAYLIERCARLFQNGLNQKHYEQMVRDFKDCLEMNETEESAIEDAVSALNLFRGMFQEDDRRRKKEKYLKYVAKQTASEQLSIFRRTRPIDSKSNRKRRVFSLKLFKGDSSNPQRWWMFFGKKSKSSQQ